ncbi:DUF302 domain-containing protein [Solemya velum gill symbiont]|uniref:DUF302 domain-containing protein n=1 Tax=Solemya velum gill symbiont TaxID=2340 RepID=A0A0B0HCE5_SOVGS|nr:DUF302 domain-containing protein [Solemya velum gill symbiont]KHF25121.1 hypothetical protein JV46_05350 [Solemya velum gill symbiont]OOY34845.1 hypothetical protein BOV88_07905 [Solemya velum gill symbiont]OOY37560.1 hypothetical protein BOV89_06740 [Solemya velum gill symbiont]OOY40182.1 hypothetical protein BOV90_05590 [Solemya velum gill symbiont]OOY44275.1 hypothetical protein BOV91_01835 [Solemya velum gill symbiont]
MKNQKGGAFVAFIVALAIGVTGTLFVIKTQAKNLLVTEIESPLGFQETIDHMKAKAKSLGWKVPSKWEANFQKNFKKIVKIDVGPVVAIKMCQVDVAANLLKKDENKYLATMMPCTFAIYQKADGKTYVSMMNLETVGNMIGGDVAMAMRQVMPDMKQMVSFE